MLVIVSTTAQPSLGVLTDRIAARGWSVARADDVTADSPMAGVLVVEGDGGIEAGEASSAALDVLKAAIAQERPVLAVGPGVEVVAPLLGGEVATRQRPEVGFPALHRTVPAEADPVAAGWPDGAAAPVLHRREVVRLPADADQLLIGSDGYSAWRVRSVLAVAPRVDLDPDTIAQWMEPGGPGHALAQEAGIDAAAIAEEAQRRAKFLRASGTSLLLRWIDGLER